MLKDDDLPTFRGLCQRSALFDQGRIDQSRRLQLQSIEKLDETPRPDAIPVILPGEIHDVRFGMGGNEFGAGPLPEREDFVIDAEIDREAPPLRSGEIRPLGDWRIGIAIVMVQLRNGHVSHLRFMSRLASHNRKGLPELAGAEPGLIGS